MNKQKTYQISNLSKKQLNVMVDALEMYTRLGLMQFDKLIDHSFGFGHIKTINGNIHQSYLKNMDKIDDYLTKIKDCLIENDDDLVKFTGSKGWSLGIASDVVNDESKISYEMEKDIEIFINTLDDRRSKSKLKLTNENDLIVREQNGRIDKMLRILEQIKNN